MSEETENLKGHEKLLAEARARFQCASAAESAIRKEALEDLRFRAGEQWPENIVAQRKLDSRPCLTINRIPQFLRQVTNEIRQNRPAIQINPVDDAADTETAEIFQGVIRHIEVSSDADVAYDTAAEHAATFGFGFFRVVTDYVSEESFDQEVRIERVKNAFTVYFDPNCQKPDYSDARYCFVIQDLDRDEFKEQFPDSEIGGLPDMAGVGDRAPGWFTDKSIRIAEYWHIEREKETLALLADGMIVALEDVPKGVEVIRTRVVEAPKVYWCKINGVEVLEEREWPGKYIPIIPVLGDEIVIDGERMLCGLVRFARDPQRMYNYWATAEAEMIALAPKAPFIGAAGQFEGYERQWLQANTRNQPYLEYKPTSAGGQPLPAPQRQTFEPPIQAMSMLRLQSADDLKATTGIYDASLGARSNEQSGRAILARQKEGDVANFHYADNLARAIKRLGRVLVDLIPKIYDAPRVLRIIGKEEEERIVAINQPVVEKGVTRIYDLAVGKYDVTVTVGPSYSTKRQEAVQSMMELSRAYPALMQVAGDLMVKSMDWPGAQQISERLKKILPANLAEDDDGEKQQIPAQARQQMEQMASQNEQLAQALDQATDTIRTKRMELDSKERIAALEGQIELVKVEAQLASRDNIELLRQELLQVRGMISDLSTPGVADEAALPMGGGGQPAMGGAGQGFVA